MTQSRDSRLWVAARALLIQPRRFLGALTCTVAVAASAITVHALAPAADTPMLAAIYGGLVVFNLLLFFPPGVLTGRPLRIVAALLATAVPLPLAPLLYGISPALADLALTLAACVSVLARPFGPPLSGFALLVALDLLIPLVLGGAPSLMRLGALAAVSGTVFAAAADAVAARLLRARSPGFEQQLVRLEIAGFLADLVQLWRSGQSWPQPSLLRRIAQIRALRDEVAPGTPGGLAILPLDAMLEGVGRCAAALHAQAGAMTAAAEACVTTSLAAVAEAVRADKADGAMQAVETLRQAALRRPAPSEPEPPARVLGLALLLSDLIEAAMPRQRNAPASA